jgi:Protein of unknown function (DUF2695)
MEKLDKAKKKAMQEAWGKQNREAARAKFPLENAQLQQFFDDLNALMEEGGSCFHDTRHAQQVADAMPLNHEKTQTLLDWCADNGGYCDCEILYNTEEHWQQIAEYTERDLNN